jgi:phosphoglycolate phosphatase
MHPVDLLIFDLDGTLIDSKDDIATCVNLTLAEVGLPTKDPKVIYGYVGDGVRRLLQQAVGEGKQEQFKKTMRIFRGHYLAHLLDTTRFYPGVEDVLDHFKGKKKTVVTNKPIEYTEKIIDGLKARERFDLILGGDGLNNLKPHPEMLHKVLEEMEVRRDRAVMVGDGINDILAARAAGIRICAVGYGLGDPVRLKKGEPDFFCERIEELKELFS